LLEARDAIPEETVSVIAAAVSMLETLITVAASMLEDGTAESATVEVKLSITLDEEIILEPSGTVRKVATLSARETSEDGD
jgi:hypothetical protein